MFLLDLSFKLFPLSFEIIKRAWTSWYTAFRRSIPLHFYIYFFCLTYNIKKWMIFFSVWATACLIYLEKVCMFGRLFYDEGSAARHSLGSEINKNDTEKQKQSSWCIFYSLAFTRTHLKTHLNNIQKKQYTNKQKCRTFTLYHLWKFVFLPLVKLFI